LRTVIGGPVAQWRRSGSPHAVVVGCAPGGAEVRALVPIIPSPCLLATKVTGAAGPLNGDGQIIAGLKRTVAGSQAQYISADAREGGSRVWLIGVSNHAAPGPANLAPCHRQRAGQVRLAVVGRRCR